MTELSLVVSIFSSAFAYSLFFASFVVLIVSIIFNTSLAVIQLQLNRVLVAASLSVQLLYLTNQMGSVYKYGLEIRRELKNLTRLPKEMKTSWMGWRVPRIAAGGWFYLHQGIPLAVLPVLLTNTASLDIEVTLTTQ